jgi:hypothetical protein
MVEGGIMLITFLIENRLYIKIVFRGFESFHSRLFENGIKTLLFVWWNEFASTPTPQDFTL